MNLVCILLSCHLVAQNVELYLDTISIISIKKIDTMHNNSAESSNVFCFKKNFYQANISPFEVLKTTCPTKKNDNMFYVGYLPITNLKSIKKLNHVIEKNKYIKYYTSSKKSISVNQLSQELIEIVSCLKEIENQVFLLSEQKAIAAFLIIDCSYNGGVHDAVFCKGKLNNAKTPILLNVLKIIK